MVRTYRLKHAINKGKQKQILDVLKAYRITASAIASLQWRLLFEEAQDFNKNLNIKYLPSPLSERYKQTCQYQVVAVLKSFISNRQSDFTQIVCGSSLNEDAQKKLLYINKYKCWYTKSSFTVLKSKLEIDSDSLRLARWIFRHILNKHRKPSFKHINMALDSKVATITPRDVSKAMSFDYWIQLSTLNKGRPVMLPLNTNRYFESVRGKIKNFCQVNMTEDNNLVISLVKDVPEPVYIPETPRVALDLGLVTLFATNNGDLMGRRLFDVLQKYDALISKLSANRQRQGLLVRTKKYRKLVSNLREFMKNEINRVINRLIVQYKPAEIIIERVSFQNTNLSRRMNRLLSWFGKSYVTKKLNAIHEELGIQVTYVNRAYSSEVCSVCGYVDKANRKAQPRFKCRCCSTGIHADVNGARNHLNRSSDKVINIYKSDYTVLHILIDRFLSNMERKQNLRLYSKAKCLLPGNPYFKDALAQHKGFL